MTRKSENRIRDKIGNINIKNMLLFHIIANYIQLHHYSQLPNFKINNLESCFKL